MINVQIGTTIVQVPDYLEPLCAELIYAGTMLELEEDWDGDGAPPIRQNTLLTTLNFLISYADAVYKHSGVPIQVPQIGPCPSGCIDIVWHTSYTDMIITVTYSELYDSYSTEYYCRDAKRERLPINGVITDVTLLDSNLLDWMSDNLINA